MSPSAWLGAKSTGSIPALKVDMVLRSSGRLRRLVMEFLGLHEGVLGDAEWPYKVPRASK